MHSADMTPAAGLAAAIDDLPASGHLCCIHDEESERLDTWVVFVRLGLERGDHCIHLAADDGAAARAALSSAGIDVDAAIRRNALSIATAAQLRLKQDAYDPYRMYTFWRKAGEAARQRGFRTVLCTNECDWTAQDSAHAARWLDYESQLTLTANQTNALFLCQCRRQTAAPQWLVPYLRAHPTVVHRGRLAENIYYAAEDLQAGRSGDDAHILLSTLEQREHAWQALRRQRDELRQKEQDLSQLRAELEEGRLAGSAHAGMSAQELSAAQAALAQVSRLTTLGELTASIAHEVAQPLAGITVDGGAALRWLTVQPPNLEEARVALGRVVENGRRATAIVERIRALSRKGSAAWEPVQVNAVILEVVALLDGELKRNDIVVATDFDIALAPVRADRVHLQQVMLNLLMNALEAVAARPGGSRGIRVTTRRHEHNGVHVTVQDRGVGLVPADLEEVFKSFYTTKPQGLGLGLAISRTIIQAHGGRLWAERNAGPGASFHFTLPGGRPQ